MALEGFGVLEHGPKKEVQDYDLVPYNDFARERVCSVSVTPADPEVHGDSLCTTPGYTNLLKMVLFSEPFVRGEPEKRRKKVVFYDSDLLERQGMLIVTVIVAYSLRPEHDRFSFRLRRGGSSDWVRAALVNDAFFDPEKPGNTEVLLELRQSLPVSWFLKPPRHPSTPPPHPSDVEAWLLSTG